MKRFLSIAFILILALSACGGGGSSPGSNSSETTQSSKDSSVTPSAQSTVEPEITPNPPQGSDNGGIPAGADEIGQGIYYYDLYPLPGDPGDGASPREGADIVVTDLLAPMGFFDTLSPPQCVYVSFDDLQFLDAAKGHECYIYSVAFGTAADGFKGDNYEVVYRAAVDYGEWKAFIYEDFDSGGQDEYADHGSDPGDTAEHWSDPGDTGTPEWWGLFTGDGFSIDITNFNGTSFSFAISNLRNGEYVLDGVAALDPENDLMAEYGQIGFSLYEDFSAVDVFVSESSEWEHLRGQYKR